MLDQKEDAECDSLAKKLEVDPAAAAKFSSDDGAAGLLQESAGRQYGLIAQAWKAEVFIESVQNEKGNSPRPLTPPRMIGELADRLGDISGKSVLTFNIEFVPLLVERGAEVTLMTRDRCEASENFVSSPALGIQSSYLTMEEAMSSEGRKFDVVIGNPPYQETHDHGKKTTGNGALWVQFLNDALGRIRGGGGRLHSWFPIPFWHQPMT